MLSNYPFSRLSTLVTRFYLVMYLLETLAPDLMASRDAFPGSSPETSYLMLSNYPLPICID